MGETAEEIGRRVARNAVRAGGAAGVHRPRLVLVQFARERGSRLASIDNTTVEKVAASLARGVALADFSPSWMRREPTTRPAGGGHGAPNLVRGGSHSGNVAAENLIHEDLLDLLSSDYVLGRPMMAGFALRRRLSGLMLPGGQCPLVRDRDAALGQELLDVSEA